MSRRPTRRAFLTGAGAAGLAAVVTACSGAPPAPAPTPPAAPPRAAPPAPTTPTVPPGAWVGDARGVALCAAISALGAELYREAANEAALGRYGTTPVVISTFLTTAAEQHGTHLEAWNAVLSAAGVPEVDGTPVSLADDTRERLAAARAPVDLAVIAADLESVLTATVTSVLGSFTGPGAIETAAGVAPVAAMRAVTASFLAGRPPGTDEAVPEPGDPAAPVPGALGLDALTAG